MFSGVDYIQPNERGKLKPIMSFNVLKRPFCHHYYLYLGEYELADGTSASTFRAILDFYQVLNKLIFFLMTFFSFPQNRFQLFLFNGEKNLSLY